jgi:outer membrane protein assembly factor BamB
MTYRDAGEDRSIFVVCLFNMIIGFDALTGAVRWKQSLGESSPIGAELVILDGLIFVLGADTPLYCFEYKTGTPRWNVTLPSQGKGVFVREGEYLYVARGDTLSCLSLSDGATQWTQNLEDQVKGRFSIWTWTFLQGKVSMGLPGNVRLGDDR